MIDPRDPDGVVAGMADHATDESAPAGPSVRTLADILADPESLKPPRAVAPRVAWAHRVTMLAAREKMGKSTLASAVAAAVSRGGLLFGQRCSVPPEAAP